MKCRVRFTENTNPTVVSSQGRVKNYFHDSKISFSVQNLNLLKRNFPKVFPLAAAIWSCS